ncbi:MAG: putative LPS assembly protein LptD [Bacteroidota bacterium]
MSLFCLCFAILVLATPAWAQVEGVPAARELLAGIQADTTRTDSLRSDSLRGDTTRVRPPRAPARSEEGRVIEFAATDSIVVSFGGEDGDVGALYGGAQLGFEGGGMTAGEVELNFGTNTVDARSQAGSSERPELIRGEERVQARSLSYNLDTEQGRLIGAQSIVEEGYVFGEVSKQVSNRVVYIKDALFTTCDHIGEPHYHISTTRMKIVDGERIFTGPVHVRVFNVPLPFWLPFGFIPTAEGRRSGPLAPTYGEDDLGFFLRDLGWYQAVNDYMDAQLQFGIWSSGSYQIKPQIRYNKRYAFNGSVSLDYLRGRRGFSTDPDFERRNVWSIRARHDQTIDPTSSLTGSIDFSTRTYLRGVSRQYDDNVRQTVGSDLNYSKRWARSGRSLTLYASQRQQLQEGGTTTLQLPRMSFRQATKNPFQRTGGGRERWYERVSYSYTFDVTNNFSFRPDTSLAGAAGVEWYEALTSAQAYEAATGEDGDQRFDFRATHRLPINATFSISKLPLIGPLRLNVTPNLQYSEDWYLRSERRALNDSTFREERFFEPGFTSIRQVSSGVSANTEFFGTFPFQVFGFNGFRHTVRPSLSYNFAPDYTSDFFGYFRSYTDTTGQVIEYPIVSGISSTRRSALTINVGNVIQGRQVRVDSTGEERKDISQLLTFNLGTSRNFAADSLQWSPLTVSGRSSLRNNRISINASAQLNPYALGADGRTTNTSYWTAERRPFRLTNLRVSAQTRIASGRSQGSSRPFTGGRSQLRAGTNPTDVWSTGVLDPFDPAYYNTPVGYADFAIPWSVNLDLTYQVSKPALVTTRRVIANTSFDFSLTPNWKIQGRSGYDFIENEIVTTSLSFLRDFHDWEMAINWQPFGRFQSFQFDLHLKTGPLREILRLRQPRADIQNPLNF